MCARVRVCVRAHACVIGCVNDCVCVCVCVQLCKHALVYIAIYVYAFAYVCVFLCMCVRTCMVNVNIHTHLHNTHMCKNILTCVYIHKRHSQAKIIISPLPPSPSLHAHTCLHVYLNVRT